MKYTEYNEYNAQCVKQTTTTTNVNTHFRLVKKWKQASVCHKSKCQLSPRTQLCPAQSISQMFSLGLSSSTLPDIIKNNDMSISGMFKYD